jgi:hypothetical protein
LTFLNIKSDLNTNDVTNSATIEQRLDGDSSYTIYIKFDINPPIFHDFVYIKTAIFNIKRLSERVLNSQEVIISRNIYSETFQMNFNFDLCRDSLDLIFEIEIMSDIGVRITNYILTASSVNYCNY